jgi:hypothetical protein
MTFDTDVAVPKDLPVGQENIAQRLHQEGFTESFRSHNIALGRRATGFMPNF